MAQCLHFNAGGRRCLREAQEESAFCLWHQPEGAPPAGEELRRWIYRLAALVLLGLFLIPLLAEGYRLLRELLN